MLTNKKSTFKFFAIALCGLTLCSCLQQQVDKDVDRTTDQAKAIMNEPIKQQDLYKMDTIAVKDDIWLGSKSSKMAAGETLPARFETDDGITLYSTKAVSLLQVSEQITALTGITVRVDDMILEAVKSATQGEDSQDGTTKQNASPDLFVANYSGKLSGFLDQIGSRFALWWKYQNKEITFYKMETRVFTIYALPVQSELSANIAGTASGESGDTTSASMSSSISLDMWSQIETAISAMLPSGATLNVLPANGTLTITAPPLTLQRVAQYINSMNERLSRQVALSVKVLNVELSDSQSFGININAVKQFAKSHTNEAAIQNVGEKSSGLAGMIMSHVTRGGNDITIMTDALAEQGKVSTITSATVVTMNNKIAPIQVSTNESYISEVSREKNDDETSYSASQEKINYGFTMEILPRLLDHGRMLIMFTMTLTDLKKMDERTFGGTDSGITMQLPKLQTRGFVQEVAMVSGDTLMLSGFEEVKSTSNKADEISGFTRDADKTRNVLVVLITPEVMISPLQPETRMNNF
ncbi:MAG: hypothetical protein MJ247_04835 [Alphaproteobacteria bacterium]|nr:hypothetical protein [Alphaproteobacteria bacterium]